MSHSIPVLFACVDEDLVFSSGSTPEDAYETEEFSRLYDTGAFWSDTSRNWWHIHLAATMAKDRDLAGLNFLVEEKCITLQSHELRAAIGAIDRLLEVISDSGLDVPDESLERYGAVVRRPEYLAELPKIEPNPKNADGFEQEPGYATDERSDAISFYCFLISLRAATVEALSAGKFLLWIVPSP